MKSMIGWVLMLVCVISCLLLTLTSASAELTDDLIHYWSMNDAETDTTTNTTTDSVGTLDGTYYNMTTGVTGILDQAYYYNGRTPVLPAPWINVSPYTQSPNMTVSIWFNRTAQVVLQGDMIAGWQGTPRGWFLNVNAAHDIHFQFSTTGVDNIDCAQNGATLNDGEYHHIVITYNTSGGSLYLDGTLNSTCAAGDGSLHEYASGLTIGSRGGAESNWNGTIDEVGMWDRAITPTEVSTLYNAGLAYTPILTTNVTYSNPVIEAFSQTILLRINNITNQTTNAILVWDGITQTITKTNYTGYDLFNSTFTTPNIDVSTKLINWTWTYNVSGLIRNITGNQTVFGFLLNNCSVSGGGQAVNFTIRDETSDALLNGTMSGYFTETESGLSFNVSWARNESHSLCVHPNWSSTFIVDAQIEYSVSGYATRTYYWDDEVLDNITDEFVLYLSNGTTQTTISVVDENDDEVAGALVYIQAYDLPTNSYITTEVLTTDYSGDAFAQLILLTQWYKFIVVYNGDIVLETTPTKILSTTLTLRVNLAGDPYINYFTVQDMTCNLYFTNATSNFGFFFLNPEGSAVNATLSVKRENPLEGTVFINSTTVESVSATILVSIGVRDDTSTYWGTGTINIDGTDYVCGSPSGISFGEEYKEWGMEGLLFAFLIILGCVMAMLWMPEAAIVICVVGVILCIATDIIVLSPLVLTTFIILGCIALYKVSKK